MVLVKLTFLFDYYVFLNIRGALVVKEKICSHGIMWPSTSVEWVLYKNFKKLKRLNETNKNIWGSSENRPKLWGFSKITLNLVKYSFHSRGGQ